MPWSRITNEPLLALLLIVTLSLWAPLPTAEYDVWSSVEPPAGIDREAAFAVKFDPLWPSELMVSVASPTFEIVKSKLPLPLPEFTRPKSCDAGETLMSGPLTATARSAALEESIPVRSCPWLAAPARPGTNAKVKSPRRTTFRKARLRIACPPSNETQNREVDPRDSSFNPSI